MANSKLEQLKKKYSTPPEKEKEKNKQGFVGNSVVESGKQNESSASSGNSKLDELKKKYSKPSSTRESSAYEERQAANEKREDARTKRNSVLEKSGWGSFENNMKTREKLYHYDEIDRLISEMDELASKPYSFDNERKWNENYEKVLQLTEDANNTRRKFNKIHNDYITQKADEMYADVGVDSSSFSQRAKYAQDHNLPFGVVAKQPERPAKEEPDIYEERDRLASELTNAKNREAALDKKSKATMPGDIDHAVTLSETNEELKKVKREIKTLTAELARFEELVKYDSYTKEITSKADYKQNSKYSPTPDKTPEQLKAEGYELSPDGNWRKRASVVAPWEYYKGEDDGVYTYINSDEDERLKLETLSRNQHGTNYYTTNGYHTLTAEEIGAYNYLYHQDKVNGTNTAEEYLAKLVPMLQKRAMAEEAERLSAFAKENLGNAIVGSVYSVGTNFMNGMMFPTKLTMTALGGYDEYPMVDQFGSETSAIRGAVSEDMPWLGKMAYNGAMSIADMGTALVAGGGNPALTQAIMSSEAGSSTLSEQKANGASDGKAFFMALGSAGIEWATEKFSIEAILSDPTNIKGFLLKNTVTEATEEGASNISNLALDSVVSIIYNERTGIERRVDELVKRGMTPEKALQQAWVEAAQSLGEDVFVGGLTGAGMAGTRVTPIAVANGYNKYQDWRNNPYRVKPTDAMEMFADNMGEYELVDSGAFGDVVPEGIQNLNEIFYNAAEEKPTEVAEAMPEVVEEAPAVETMPEVVEDAPATIEEAAMAVVRERNKEAMPTENAKEGTKGVSDVSNTIPTPEARTAENGGKKASDMGLAETLDYLSSNNEAIPVEAVKMATNFGDNGAKVVTELANTEGMTFSKAKGAVETAYRAGLTNLDGDKVKFTTDVQINAFTAGKADRLASDIVAREKAKAASIRENGFTENEYSKKLTSDERKLLETVAKDFKMDAEMVDRVIANHVTMAEANAEHVDGKMNISSKSKKLIYSLALHEGGHRMRQLNPDAFSPLMDYLYESAEQNARRLGLGDTGVSLFDSMRERYNNAGIEITADGIIEEIAVRQLETIFSSAEEFNNWRKQIESNSKVKNAWQKFIETLKEFFEDLWAKVTKSTMSLEAKRQAQAEINKARQLLADAYGGAMESADARAKEVKAKGAEGASKTSEVSSRQFSLSSIGAAFFGNENVTASEVERMLEDGSYKDFDGYRNYVKDCTDVFKQSHPNATAEDIAQIEDSIEGIMRVAVAAKKAGYDIFDDGRKRSIKDSKKRLLFSSLEPNSDYITSGDIATICDKRINFSEIYEDIVRLEEARNVPIDERFFNNVDNYFVLHKIMAEKGLTVPCEECYVESMRKNLAPMAKAFIELITETDASNKANAQLYNQEGKNSGELKKNNAKIREKVRRICAESGGAGVQSNKFISMDADNLAKLGEDVNGTIGNYGLSVNDITVEMLTTAEGLATLKLQAPLIYETFNSFYGQSKPKMPREATPFRPGELIALLTDNNNKINKKTLEKIKSTGGFRLQSYSDFQIKNFVDVLHTIFEASMLGLNGHAYTKVPAFLEATEGTNLKRNLSIFMYDDGGKWVLDKKNSFPMELEDIYALVASDDTGNTSIIAVSQNAEMSAWIMANDLVGYGIPFHKSGLKMEVVRARVVKTEDGREVLGYANEKDHTAQQSEVYKKTLSEKKKENTKVKNPIDIYKFWDFDNKGNLSKNELIEKNLKAYIDECEKRNYRPKFREYVMDNDAVLENVLTYAKESGFVSEDATVDDISFKYGEYTIPYGYYKFLGDFGMFTPEGEASPIKPLSLADYNFDKAVDFFNDSSKLRVNELLQQFENGKVRKEYREKIDKGELTVEQLDNIVRAKRGEVVSAVINRQFSLMDDVDVSPKNTKAYLDTVEDVRKGKVGAADRLAKYIDKGMITSKAYEEMIEKYGAIEKGEKPHRDVSVPQKTEKDKKVSKTVRTVLEAKVTPDEAVPTIEKMVEDGVFSYEAYSDEQAIKDAEDYIKGYGWDESLDDWLHDVEKGIVSKQHTATGWALYNNAATIAATTTSESEKKTATHTALKILDAMVKHQRSAAQALQATRILKKLSPETQLYQVQRTVDSFQKEVEKKYGTKDADKYGKDIDKTAKEARKKAAGDMANLYKNGKVSRRGKKVVIEGNMVGEPFVFEYAQKVGEDIARSLENKRNSVKREKTFLEHISSQLKRFANEKLPPTEKGKSLTAVDMLRDYIQNRDFYSEAWESAQQELREKYADDEMLGEFINSGIGMDANINPRNAIFMRALVQSATESEETKSNIIRQSALGVTKMSENIANKLIAETGAEGEMAQTIRDAAAGYVHSVLAEAETDTENPVDETRLINNAIKGAMRDIGITLSEVVTSGTKADAKQAITDKLITKYAFGVAEATNTAEIVARQFEEMSRQYAERRLESMFKKGEHNRKTISEQLRMLGNLGAFDIGSEYNGAATQRIFKTDIALHIDETLAERFLQAETDEERLEIEIEIYRDIGRQMPSSWVDKWNAWRYLAMLGNLRTHGRNILGNAFFAPVVATKNLTATIIESIVYPISGKKMVRGKSLVWGSKNDRALLKAAWDDYGNVADLVSNGGKYSDFALANKHIEEGRKIFKPKALAPLEKARKLNSKALEVEDVWFSKPHYAYALAQYCKANNITPEQIARGKAIAPAREYAIKEAQKATYKDTNAFSQMVSGLGKSHGEKNWITSAKRTLVEGVLPFRKTPANILVRGIEYSPFGLLKGISYDLIQVGKGKMTATEAIDHISAGLTGTGLLGLGIWLAAEGLIRGHGEDEEKEKEFKEMMGHQAYSLELPDGTSVTLDWLAPEALPFFVGVNLWEATKKADEKVTMSTILETVTGISEPMLEMSCLQGLNDLIEGVGYASSNGTSGLFSIVSSALTSYVTQGVPTLFGQAERTGEEYRMTTYTEKNGILTGDMQYALGKISAKIPGWDYSQIPYIDAWGRKEASGVALKRGLNNFLNPAYTSTIDESEMEKELLRLYEETGETSVFPKRADKYFTVDKERKDLTADEYIRYATLKGEKSYKLISDLVKSDAYKKLDDDEKVAAIEEAYDYANQKAKETVGGYTPDKWVKTADDLGSGAGNFFSFRASVSDTRTDNGGTISKNEVADIILDIAENDSEAWGMYLSMYESSGALSARDKGVDGMDYVDFVIALDKYDKPTDSGKLGTYTQDEAKAAINSLNGLTKAEKAALYQSVNSAWKNNPYK